ncbi:YhgE/Pip domain-containing protein [uncultured Clostridium sp.]|jgi:putative membrane protein|uniref:YhgE/Pip domain-containing protein n=1 Tax=uncultured Clostridium sp. TaxID=59620 RepID=UPI0026237A7E|nr:YhgE/Pip domain-containing protein [uncultured Clostridium sp.]
MKKIFKIFTKDLKKIFTNRAAILVIVGICFIPSLYAWITLKANWNPYVNTANIAIGVVNEDMGTIVNGKIMNVGDQVMDELKTNTSIGWKPTTVEAGDAQLRDGKYYALIIIPKDFSQDLASLTTANTMRPTIIYKVNDKTNIIATKITEVANEQLTNQITDNFVKAVNEQTIALGNSLGKKLKTSEPVLNQLKSVMDSADTKISEIKGNINNSSESATKLSNYLDIMKHDLPQITGQINSLQSVVEASKSLISSTQNNVNSVASSISSNTPNITNTNNELSNLIGQLKQLSDTAGDNSSQKAIIDNAIGVTNKLIAAVDKNINLLEGINNQFKNPIISAGIQKLNDVKALIVAEQNQLSSIKGLYEKGEAKAADVNAKLTGLQTMNTNLMNSVTALSSNMYSSVVPTVNNLSSNLTQGLNNANSLLESSKSLVPQLQSLANFGISTSDMTVSKANELKTKINGFKNTLDELQEKAGQVNDADLNKMIDMLSKNPGKISSFLASPINVKQEEIYGSFAFGVGIMPFYTVLAIWVGSLLLTSLFTVEAKNNEEDKPNHLQVHFGKMLLFLTLSFVQTTIVTLGDKFVLGFSPYNMWLMMGIAWLCSFTFTMIIYTLVSLFGSMGKALCVVIMVFQVAGSGAIYPIQTNPEIFRQLEFLWPFKYALDGFREAIAGPIWSYVQNDVISLLIFAGVFFLLGFLKPLLHKQTHFMETKFKESGL